MSWLTAAMRTIAVSRTIIDFCLCEVDVCFQRTSSEVFFRFPFPSVEEEEQAARCLWLTVSSQLKLIWFYVTSNNRVRESDRFAEILQSIVFISTSSKGLNFPWWSFDSLRCNTSSVDHSASQTNSVHQVSHNKKFSLHWKQNTDSAAASLSS